MTRHCWTRIGCLNEIPRAGARVVRRAGQPNVAVFRTAIDRLFALLDRCPHRGAPLSRASCAASASHVRSITRPSSSNRARRSRRIKAASKPTAVKVDEGVVYVDLCEHAGAVVDSREAEETMRGSRVLVYSAITRARALHSCAMQSTAPRARPECSRRRALSLACRCAKRLVLCAFSHSAQARGEPPSIHCTSVVHANKVAWALLKPLANRSAGHLNSCER